MKLDSRLAYVGLAGLAAAVTFAAINANLDRPLDWDPARFSSMARGLADTGRLVDDQGQPWRMFPPLVPLLLAAAYAAGASVEQARLVFVLISVAVVTVVAWLSEQLTGSRWLAVIFGVSLTTNGYMLSSQLLGYAEFLVMGLYAIVVSSIARARLAAVGTAAGLCLLTKASVGIMLFAALAAGVAWRLRHAGARGLMAREYVIGGLVFLAVSAWWVARNIVELGLPHWSTQPYALGILDVFAQEGFLVVFAAKLASGVAWLAVTGGWLGVLALAFGRVDRTRLLDETGSLLLLATVLVIVTAQLYSAAYYFSQDAPYVIERGELRYILPAVPTFTWLCWHVAGVPRPGTRHELAMVVGLAIAALGWWLPLAWTLAAWGLWLGAVVAVRRASV